MFARSGLVFVFPFRRLRLIGAAYIRGRCAGIRSRLPCLYSTTLPPLLQLTKRRNRLRRKVFRILTLPTSPERAFFAFEVREIPESVYRAFLRVLRHTQKQHRQKQKKKVFSSDFLPRQNAQTTPRRGNDRKQGKAPHPRTHAPTHPPPKDYPPPIFPRSAPPSLRPITRPESLRRYARRQTRKPRPKSRPKPGKTESRKPPTPPI